MNFRIRIRHFVCTAAFGFLLVHMVIPTVLYAQKINTVEQPKVIILETQDGPKECVVVGELGMHPICADENTISCEENEPICDRSGSDLSSDYSIDDMDAMAIAIRQVIFHLQMEEAIASR